MGSSTGVRHDRQEVSSTSPVRGNFFAEFFSLIQFWHPCQNDLFTEKLECENHGPVRGRSLSPYLGSINIFLFVNSFLSAKCLIISTAFQLAVPLKSSLLGPAILFSLRLIWEITEITLRSNPQLWLADTNWDWNILVWDSQIDNKVVYEYISHKVEISKICPHFSVNLWRRNITFFTLEIHNWIIQRIEFSWHFFWYSQLEIIRN